VRASDPASCKHRCVAAGVGLNFCFFMLLDVRALRGRLRQALAK
jgi:hypothetical protein